MLLLPVISLCLPLILLLLHFVTKSKKKHTFPPGPRPLPVLGNLVYLLLLQRNGGNWDGEKKKRNLQPLHAVLASISRSYGPLIHLRLGSQTLVVASSPATAAEVLRTQDRILSARHVPASYRIPIYADHSLVWSDSSDHWWKSLRSLCHAQLFSPRSLEAGAQTREKKAKEMVGFFQGKEGVCMKVADVAFRTVFNMFANTVLSKDLGGLEEDKGGSSGGWGDMKKDMARALEIGKVPNIEDYFPELVGGWDPQGLRKEVLGILRKFYAMWDDIVLERKKELQMKSETCEKDDFLKVLLLSGLQGSELNAFFQDIFTAGTDTTTTSIEWTMAKLIKNPGIMKQIRDELETLLGKPKEKGESVVIREFHLTHLPYLQACIKESLRLHPPAPLLLPHRAAESCEVMSYTVPKGCVVMVNVWAIGRDPENWEDPLVFSPERFMKTEKDFKGKDFEFIPFGSGRRVCPGLMLANRIIALVVASMVYNFDWHLPDGLLASELCMEEKLGIVLERKEPLVLIPRHRG